MNRILLVDDEPNVLDSLRTILRQERKRWETVYALGGPAALEAMREAPFDVIVTDMRMPGMDGAALLERVRHEHPDTVRIVLSGYAEEGAALRAIPVAHQFLTKPCEPTLFIGALARACAVRSLITRPELRRLINSIDTLPPRPSTYTALLTKLGDPKARTAEVATLVEEDVAISARLLQLVNSAFFGMPRPVTSVDEAVALIGFRTVRDLTLSASIFSLPVDIPHVAVEALEQRAVLVGRIARHITADRTLVDDAFMTGLLLDIGVLVNATKLPRQFERTLAVVRDERLSLHTVEQRLWGVTHAEVGAYLLGIWNLPPAIVEAVGYHHRPAAAAASATAPSLVAIAHVAERLAREVAPGLAPIQDEPMPELDLDFLRSVGLIDELDACRQTARAVAAGELPWN